jgi:cytochrome c peroxidase
MKRFAIIGILLLTAVLIMQACVEHTATPDDSYDFQTPPYFPKIVSPTNNPLTKSGVSLGRMLFYDPILSQDSTISCSSCHNIANAFAEDSTPGIPAPG